MNAKYNPGSWFQGKVVNKKKTRKIQHEHFPKLPHVQQLIKIFENLHNDVRVTKVWLLKKKDKGDGFEEFHYGYKNSGGGSNYVSFTVNVNLEKLNEDNDIATMKISLPNEESSVLSKTSKEEMMQKLSLQEKEEINRLPKEDLHCLKSGMLYTKGVNYYMDYLKEQDEKMQMKIHRRKPSLFFNIGFITFNNTNNPKFNTKTPRCARGKNIFDMRCIFIPIHHGLHFTCAVRLSITIHCALKMEQGTVVSTK
jgi:Ulp1 family protease